MSARGMTETVLATEFEAALAKDWGAAKRFSLCDLPAVAEWLRNVAAAITPTPPPRHTALGMLPIDVNSIDRLDQVITQQRDGLRAVAEITQRLSDAQFAIEYAAAHTAWRDLKALGCPDADATRRWKRARKAYLRNNE